jgi:hypothetical protein
MVRTLVMTAVLALGACTFTGPKGGNPGWKIFKEEQDRPVPSQAVRLGAAELRLTRVFLRREYTVTKTVNWTAWIRATVVSAEKLPASSFDGVFKVIGRSGKTYDAHTQPTGPGRSTWQHQEHTGEPTHLPPNVPGELEIWISFESSDGKAPDELAALTFRDGRVAL